MGKASLRETVDLRPERGLAFGADSLRGGLTGATRADPGSLPSPDPSHRNGRGERLGDGRLLPLHRGAAPLQVGVDEQVDLAVEDTGDVADLGVGAEVLRHLIRLKDI